ncbi:histidinol-phosphate transaminase [Pseudoalteromonas sp. L23]|uniref:histidinol-phosphate transaminase n=1 Tax=unclassified Pseudoalteromonas TaxID=194690 RepID=UPI001EF03E23|nr:MULTISPECIES: histidinol-phosphate transaminase [unclassified Pseudoalteromonas]MCF7513437.1 histidinol-phosphate transaminase [Pseudoalteromonas sp. L7]MCF7525586.1 histidinol-phosphate transaminase [Pseudoalteromonas sp. L23]
MTNIALPNNIEKLKAYSSAKSAKLTGTTWLNANESPYARVLEMCFDNLNRYPDPQPQAVIDAYAGYAKVEQTNVLMTRGADEGIELLVRTYCEPAKDSIAIFTPTYGMYKVTADTHNIAINELSQAQLAKNDVGSLISAIGDAKLVFVCNPNNPTGAIQPASKVAALADKLKGRAIVVVDEAYIEFCEEQTCVELIKEFSNVVVLRTLSKAFALAGLRVGFMLASEALLAPVRKVIAPYPVSTVVAQIAATALTSDAITQMRRQVSILNLAKKKLIQWLQDSEFVSAMLCGEGNFVTLQLTDKQFVEQAMRQGLIMRPFVLFGEDNWLRISIGNEQELKQVENWLKQCQVTEEVS